MMRAKEDAGRGRSALRSRDLHADERGVIIEWLLKVGIWLVIVALVLFDAGSIVVNVIQLDSTAQDIAVAVSTDVGDGNLVRQDQIEDVVEPLAEEAGAKLVEAKLDDDGDLVVRLRRRADTLIVGRIGPIKDWAVTTADGQAGVD